MRLTTATSLRGTSVTLTSGTSSLLRSWFLARTCNISACLDALPNGFTLVLKVFKHFMSEVSSQGLVKQVLIECDDLVGEAAIDEAVDGHLQLLSEVEGTLSPRLLHKKGLLGAG